MYAAKLVAILALAAAVSLPAFAQPIEYEKRELSAREPRAPQSYEFAPGTYGGHNANLNSHMFAAREDIVSALLARAEGHHAAAPHHPKKPHHGGPHHKKPHHKGPHHKKPHHKKPHHKKPHHKKPHHKKPHHGKHHGKKPHHPKHGPKHGPKHVSQHHARAEEIVELLARDTYSLAELWKGIKASFHLRRAVVPLHAVHPSRAYDDEEDSGALHRSPWASWNPPPFYNMDNVRMRY